MTSPSSRRDGQGADRDAFTPGPWRVEPSESPEVNGRNFLTVLSVADANGLTVVRITEAGHQYATDLQRANARLIAAAPELLAALEAMLNEAAAVGSPSLGACHNARAALALARVPDRETPSGADTNVSRDGGR